MSANSRTGGGPLLVLGIETSCDETAAALVTGEGDVLPERILSQLDQHRPYGGIVPEIAARAQQPAQPPERIARLGRTGWFPLSHGLVIRARTLTAFRHGITFLIGRHGLDVCHVGPRQCPETGSRGHAR